MLNLNYAYWFFFQKSTAFEGLSPSYKNSKYLGQLLSWKICSEINWPANAKIRFTYNVTIFYFSRINCIWGFVTKSDHCSSWTNWGILVECWNCNSKFFGCWTNWTHWNSHNYHWNHYTQYRRTCDWWVWIGLKANKKPFHGFSLASYRSLSSVRFNYKPDYKPRDLL